jgi:thiamine-monophosphate kinase
MKLERLSERSLIAAIRKEFARPGKNIRIGIGDDAAVLRPGKLPLILTKDLLVEDVDFIRKIHPAYYIGRKSLNVNLSDVAAMGGNPKYALLGLGFPADLPTNWVREFMAGFESAARQARVQLIGGDISRAKQIVISVTVLGEAKKPVTRSGAGPGHLIFVSGCLGDAKLGFVLTLKGLALGGNQSADRLLRAFLDPVPQIELGRELAQKNIASSMIDISDGLSVDLMHLCEESGTGAEIELQSLPLSPGMKKFGGKRAVEYALHGGEDFELLFTATLEKERLLEGLKKKFRITNIGRITRRKGIFALDPCGAKRSLSVKGYEHFTSKETNR